MKFLIIIAIIFCAACKESPKEKSTSMPTEETAPIASEENKSSTIDDNMEYAQASVNDGLAKKVANYLKNDYLKDDYSILMERDKKFQLYEIDLNEDGEKEIFINFMTPYFCGTGGCSMLLLNADLKKISHFSVMNPPLFVEKTMKNGWKILLIKDRGEFKELLHLKDGYPSNPSVLPKAPYDAPSGHAEILFDENYSKAKTYTF
ncbi:hypothetical protein [Galbibacter mesophilus]|uniref:hypothetical protein n=1 Tax=Galbibacter mesophilus TaxID=379069 RepID=UPI00191D07BF|nr:hypothetical protein [Galbibacter mesophilus]MCM5664162.1 hypothetical protein [Galbibacter mesophilus]